jgi:hypothetical protein
MVDLNETELQFVQTLKVEQYIRRIHQNEFEACIKDKFIRYICNNKKPGSYLELNIFNINDLEKCINNIMIPLEDNGQVDSCIELLSPDYAEFYYTVVIPGGKILHQRIIVNLNDGKYWITEPNIRSGIYCNIAIYNDIMYYIDLNEILCYVDLNNSTTINTKIYINLKDCNFLLKVNNNELIIFVINNEVYNIYTLDINNLTKTKSSREISSRDSGEIIEICLNFQDKLIYQLYDEDCSEEIYYFRDLITNKDLLLRFDTNVSNYMFSSGYEDKYEIIICFEHKLKRKLKRFRYVKKSTVKKAIRN